MIHSLEDKTKRELVEIVKIQIEEYQVVQKRIAELEEIAKAVAHIGIDFGYGKYEIEEEHIENSRQYFLTKGGDS